ncbi:radical SAM protein [Helicobacter sp. MIT 05-5293]|uniref:radical SAM protein n=1 Tax=Helicobacter sp. MIT 05-5293 TaxID=1548149 RepID=UPI00051D3703|nr:radical SAM protein [Helicobacter sp. MIT 05-5293]TLD82036.1 radical SAM protein [Helicobacter sp. MIT 05-5293]
MKVNHFNSSEKILRYTNKIDYFLNAHKTLIVTELDLTNKCNHRCPGCCGHNENNAELSKDQITTIVENLKAMDNKGVILSGGGEPTLSLHFGYAVESLKRAGMNIGLNSNGGLLNEEKCHIIAKNLEYFRISLDAGSALMYEKIHGMKPHHFEKTLENIAMFAKIKTELDSQTSFGIGFLTSKETQEDMEKFVLIIKEIAKKHKGINFVQFRPFIGDTFDISPILENLKAKYEEEDFKILASFQKYNEMANITHRGYDKCHGMFFSTVISADFKVWACLHFRQSAKHFLGDLKEQSLEEIWRGARIKEVYQSIDCQKCPILCRNDSFNKTLDKLSLDIINSEFL